MTTEILERRVLSGSTVNAEAGEKPTISGVGAVFNQYTDMRYFVEIIEPGFFDDVLDDDVRSLFNHDDGDILGRSGNGTLRFSQDDNGLPYQVDINPQDDDAMSVYQKVKRGDVTGSSIMFIVKSMERGDDANGDEWYALGDKIVRRLKKGGCKELWDIGPVTFPAYEQTSASARSKAEEMRKALSAVVPGQEPENDAEEIRKVAQAQARRRSRERMLLLSERSLLPPGEKIMNVRELLSQRAAKLAEARTLATLADTEARDFSDEERGKFDGLMTEVETLGSQIVTIQDERERLRTAETNPPAVGSEPEKPAPDTSPKTIKRDAFDALNPAERAVAVRSGVKIED
jgi:HK97 family phage prohead protease